MSWGLVAGAAISVVGGSIASNKANKASGQQVGATMAGIESQEKMFDKSLELQQPYREAGYGALEGLQGLVDPTQRAETLQGYYGGEEYKALSGQVEEQQLRNAAATGGIRGGANQAALATIAPKLGQQYLSGLNQQYTGLANMGMGAASQGSSQAMQLGGNVSALQQQAGQARAANSLAQGNIWGNVIQDVGALGYDYFGRGK
jgi:hypothetical protein